MCEGYECKIVAPFGFGPKRGSLPVTPSFSKPYCCPLLSLKPYRRRVHDDSCYGALFSPPSEGSRDHLLLRQPPPVLGGGARVPVFRAGLDALLEARVLVVADASGKPLRSAELRGAVSLLPVLGPFVRSPVGRRRRQEDRSGRDSLRGLRLQSLAYHDGIPQGPQAHARGDGGDLRPDAGQGRGEVTSKFRPYILFFFSPCGNYGEVIDGYG